MGKVYMGKNLNINECKPGMKIMDEVKGNTGLVLVTPGVVLTDELIQRLKGYKVAYVTVRCEDLEMNTENHEWLEEELLFSQNDYEKNLSKYEQKVDLKSNSVYKGSIRIMNNVLEELEKGKDLDLYVVKGVIAPLFNEIIQNNNFLVCLDVLKKKSLKTYSHSVNTAVFAGLIGKWLELDNEKIINLIFGGLLHDIGTVKISKDMIEVDEKAYQRHPILGYKEVLNIGDIEIAVKRMILSHHENCDGTGYPFGLTRENISFESRILAVADRFDEIYFDKYADNGGIFLALEKLYNEEITKLDFQVLDVFARNMLWNNIGRYAVLSDNRIAQIIFINYHNRFKPLVKIKNKVIDLSTEIRVKLKKII